MANNDADFQLTAGITGTEDIKSAIQDVAVTGANAFQQLTEAVESGNFAGLAELIGGPVAGAFVAAAQAIYDFVNAQAEAIENTNALAEANDTSTGAILGLKKAYEEAGLSSDQASQAIGRATTRIAQISESAARAARDDSAAQEQAANRVEGATLRVAEAKEHLDELGTAQAQRAIADSDAQADAALNLAKITQKQVDDLTGTPNADMEKLFKQQQDIQDVTKAQHAVAAENIKSANEQANEPLETAKAQLDVREAETAKIQSVNSAYDKLLTSITAVTEALSKQGGPLAGGDLSKVLPNDLLRGFTQVVQNQPGRDPNKVVGTDELQRVIATALHDQTISRQQGLGIEQRLEGGRDPAVLNKLVDSMTQLGDKFAKPEANLSPAAVDSAKGFLDGTREFSAAVHEFSERVVGELLAGLRGTPPVPGHASGGMISGPGTGTSDSVLARLSRGEFVTRAAAVQKYGVDMFHALNNMELPGFAMGGLVSPIARLAGGGEVVSKGNILNLSIDGHQFNGLRADDNVAKRLTNYAISRQTAQTGKKPSWLR